MRLNKTKIRFAPRVERISQSPTLAMLNRANDLISRGIDVVDFGPGEPDFATPESVCNAAKEAIDAGCTKYTNAIGTNELRDTIAASYHQRYGANVKRSNVVAGNGGKQELFNIILALVDYGDEVVIPSPYWVSFPDQVRFAGGTPVFAKLDDRDLFRPTFDAIAAVITDKTRGIILNSPCNPTGAVIEEKELERIIRFCAERDIFLIFDETYEFFVYGGQHHVSAAKWFNEFPETVILVNSMSKTYAMTGWRIGYAIAHPEIAAALGKIQSHSTSNPSSISQLAAVEALRGTGAEVQKMFKAYEERRSWLVPAVNEIPGMSCPFPDGAFYVFVRVSELFGRGEIVDSVSLATWLLEQARVAVVPGAAFGADEFVRISYATSMERLREGVARIKAAVDGLI